MATTFRNFNPTRKAVDKSNDRENLPPAFTSTKFAGKENVLSERRHTGRKQVFGELKNVLHNTGAPTPMKAPKSTIFSPTAPPKNILKPKEMPKSKKSLLSKQLSLNSEAMRTVPQIDLLPKFDPDYDDLEYIWSQQTAALAERAFARIRHVDDEELLLPDISAMDKFESVFGEIEPIALENFDEPEPEMPSLPSIEWDNMLFDF
ncbi:unnamed protein product [Hermetia illucens]|uniref:Securin n=1 Tax=Hermetia illucens TaxID=343691 RepID=A0A7R8V7N3_HERIL|nr:uncharacterized protein LOC119659246 [Hermetia illucens]CAD7093637.1 unnamed protein product [Hermetia illucens]